MDGAALTFTHVHVLVAAYFHDCSGSTCTNTVHTLVFVSGVICIAPGEKQGDPCVDELLLWELPPPAPTLLPLLGTVTDSDTAFPKDWELLAKLLLNIKASSTESESLSSPLPLLVLSSVDRLVLWWWPKPPGLEGTVGVGGRIFIVAAISSSSKAAAVELTVRVSEFSLAAVFESSSSGSADSSSLFLRRASLSMEFDGSLLSSLPLLLQLSCLSSPLSLVRLLVTGRELGGTMLASSPSILSISPSSASSPTNTHD